LVEWPEKGRGFLPQQDIEVHLRAGLAEDLRDLELIGRTERGLQQVKQLSAEAGAIE
jgi:tRNA A37 threonylcarbamoyladenosine biosynthesis protein TsaE